MESFKIMVKQTILNFKYYFNSKSQVVLSFLILFAWTLIMPTILFTLSDSYGIIVTMPISVILFILYSGMIGQYRNSTLYLNSKITKTNRWTFNFASLLTLIIIGYSVFFVQTIILIIMAKLRILSNSLTFFTSNNNNIFIFSNMSLSWNLYWVFTTIIITFSISFGLYRFIEKPKTFFIFITTISFLGIIFGGTFNDFFKIVFVKENAIEGDKYFLNFESSLFPKSMYLPSVLFPYYSPNEMLNISGRYMSVNYENGAHLWWPAPNYNIWNWQHSSDYVFNNLNPQAWRFNLLYFLPYIHSVVWASLGIGFSYLKNN